MDIRTALTEYGLNEKEVTAYLFLLQHGAQTAHSLAKGTGILRQTAYDLLGNLEHKGLVSEVIQNDKKHFMAENPKALVHTLKEKEEIITKVLNDLEKMQNISRGETRSKLFRGVKGIKLLYEDFLTSKTEIKTIQPDIPENFLKEYFVENFSLKRIEKKIPIKVLKEKIVTEFQKNMNTNKKMLREVRTSKQLSNFNSHFVLYDGKLVMMDYRNEPVAFLIENELFSQSFNTLFDSIWSEAKAH